MRRAEVGFLLGALLAVAAGCGYSPNPPSRELICGPNSSCPEDYTCVSGTCWRSGEAKLVGHWVFGANSTLMRSCDDGSKHMENLQGPDGFIDVDPGTTSGLSTFYFCPWKLDVVGSSTTIQAGQSCSAQDMMNPTITYTWHGESLAVTSSDGKKGSLAASFPTDYGTLTGTTLTEQGTCTMKITADLTKQ